MTRARELGLKLGLAALGVALVLVAAELVYRTLLFGKAAAFERWRDRGLLLHAPFVPRRVRDVVTGHRALTARKIAVNERILGAALRELRDAGTPFVVVVFHYVQEEGREFSVEREDNWRDRLSRETLHRHGRPTSGARR